MEHEPAWMNGTVIRCDGEVVDGKSPSGPKSIQAVAQRPTCHNALPKSRSKGESPRTEVGESKKEKVLKRSFAAHGW
jgi:hypothetical protein